MKTIIRVITLFCFFFLISCSALPISDDDSSADSTTTETTDEAGNTVDLSDCLAEPDVCLDYSDKPDELVAILDLWDVENNGFSGGNDPGWAGDFPNTTITGFSGDWRYFSDTYYDSWADSASGANCIEEVTPNEHDPRRVNIPVSDTTGGLEILEDYDVSPSYNIGTWRAKVCANEWASYEDMSEEDLALFGFVPHMFEKCSYSFPDWVDTYSDSDTIGFKDERGKTVIVATTNTSNTFDFSENNWDHAGADLSEIDHGFDFTTMFLDSYGDTSSEVACSCVVNDNSPTHYADEIMCHCEGTDGEQCLQMYERE